MIVLFTNEIHFSTSNMLYIFLFSLISIKSYTIRRRFRDTNDIIALIYEDRIGLVSICL